MHLSLTVTFTVKVLRNDGFKKRLNVLGSYEGRIPLTFIFPQ